MTTTMTDIAYAREEMHRRLWGLRDYAKKRLKIRVKRVGSSLIPFVFNEEQEIIFGAWQKQYDELGYVRSIVLKPRQVGSSTLCCAYGFSYAAQLSNINVVTFAHEVKTAKEIFRTVSIFYEELPPALRPAKRGDTQDGMEFQARRGEPTDGLHRLDNLRSSYTVMTAGQRQQGQVQGIGRAIHFLHLSEGARYPNPEAIVTGPINAVPDGDDIANTVILSESTARPEGVWFKSEWEYAKQRRSLFRDVFLRWDVMQAYRIHGASIHSYTPVEAQLIKHFRLTDEQLQWRRNKIKQLQALESVTGVSAEDLFAQDYPIDDQECWRVSGTSVFSKNMLAWAAAHFENPRFIGSIIQGQLIDEAGIEQDGHPPLHIWERPNTQDEYIIAGDVGQGIPAGDFSVGTVWNTRTCEQAAEWRGRIDPADFGTVLSQLGYMYNTAQIGVEINNHGYTTQSVLSSTGYPHFFRQKRHERIGQDYQPERVGWYTSSRTKPYLVGMGQRYLGQKLSTIRSRTLADELKNYICLDSGSWGASAGWHDDTVSAYLIAMAMMQDEYLTNGGTDVLGHERRLEDAGVSVNTVTSWDHDTDPEWWKAENPGYTLTWR